MTIVLTTNIIKDAAVSTFGLIALGSCVTRRGGRRGPRAARSCMGVTSGCRVGPAAGVSSTCGSNSASGLASGRGRALSVTGGTVGSVGVASDVSSFRGRGTICS